jgi:hypothetical protein
MGDAICESGRDLESGETNPISGPGFAVVALAPRISSPAAKVARPRRARKVYFGQIERNQRKIPQMWA